MHAYRCGFCRLWRGWCLCVDSFHSPLSCERRLSERLSLVHPPVRRTITSYTFFSSCFPSTSHFYGAVCAGRGADRVWLCHAEVWSHMYSADSVSDSNQNGSLWATETHRPSETQQLCPSIDNLCLCHMCSPLPYKTAIWVTPPPPPNSLTYYVGSRDSCKLHLSETKNTLACLHTNTDRAAQSYPPSHRRSQTQTPEWINKMGLSWRLCEVTAHTPLLSVTLKDAIREPNGSSASSGCSWTVFVG